MHGTINPPGNLKLPQATNPPHSEVKEYTHPRLCPFCNAEFAKFQEFSRHVGICPQSNGKVITLHEIMADLHGKDHFSDKPIPGYVSRWAKKGTQ